MARPLSRYFLRNGVVGGGGRQGQSIKPGRKKNLKKKNFLRNGAYRLEIISAYSEKGSGPKLKPYSHWTTKVWGVLIASVTISASYSLLSKLY